MHPITLISVGACMAFASELSYGAEPKPTELGLVTETGFFVMHLDRIELQDDIALVPVQIDFKTPQYTDSKEVYSSASILAACRCRDRAYAIVSQRSYGDKGAKGPLVRAVEHKLKDLAWKVPRYGTIEARQVEAVCEDTHDD